MKENRTIRITIRFTATEYEKLLSGYKRTTCRTLVTYARKVLAAKPVTVTYRNRSLDDFMHELIKIRNDLNAVGNNFNQVVKKINSVQDNSLQNIWLPYAQSLQKELLTRIEYIQQRINQFSSQWLQK